MGHKTRPGHFIKLPKGYSVSVPRKRTSDRFEMLATGIYITWDHTGARMHYAGPDADKSYADFEIPEDPEFLRFFAKELLVLADKIDEERIL